MTSTGPSAISSQDAERLARALEAARGTGNQFLIVPENGNGGKRLNSIILGIASFAAGALLSLIIWQLNRLTDKVDDVNGRLIRVETTIGAKP